MKTHVTKQKAVEGPDGRLYRAEWRVQRSCTEVGIRGPFEGSPFYSSGKPKFRRGYRTAFKIQGGKAMPTNPIKSKKAESEMDMDWVHFATELGYGVR